MKNLFPPTPPVSGYESPAAKVAKSLVESTKAAPKGLLTECEKSKFLDSGRYAEVAPLIGKLAKASPFITMSTFGKSGEGRDLNLVVVSKDKAFTPAAAKATGKPIVLVQNGIHPGEISGKDASFMLLRDILVTKRYAHLLDHLTLLFIPIFNPDGHERLSPYNRINQNGPRLLGFRANAMRYNLNRDYIKADTPEMQGWLRMWTAWLPDFFIDNHVTDGQDHQYDVTICMATEQEIHSSVGKWTSKLFLPSVTEAMERDGHIIGPYYEPMNKLDLSEGVEVGPNQPRYSNGYVAIHHRPGLLVETHSLKSHRTQTWAHYDLMVHTFDQVAKYRKELRKAITTAEAAFTKMGEKYAKSNKVYLAGELSDENEPMILRGISSHIEEGEISGAPVVVYGDEPIDIETRFYGKFNPVATPLMPLGYLVPPQWKTIIGLLELHGVKTEVMAESLTDEFETYRFSQVSWEEKPFEGRHLCSFSTHLSHEIRTLPEGSVFVPMNQPASRVAMNLLEPQGVDSLVKWGFFDTIFEQKEDFEDYVMEPIAQMMYEADEDLREEFLARIETDDAFAEDSYARLAFFYRRSGYFERDKNAYPIVRVTKRLKD
ncbi:MAG: M14 family metallopeptidase [Blastocatellia bacterium]|nr:M14 family metallopeptidase [Blastocatellia bacterium]